MKKRDNIFVPIIISLSVIIPIAVAFLMLFPNVFHIASENYDFSSLPFFHAVLNGSTAILIFTGFVLIKNKKTGAEVVKAPAKGLFLKKVYYD